jgi:hypothetical protein
VPTEFAFRAPVHCGRAWILRDAWRHRYRRGGGRVVVTAPAPQSPINVCALLPSMDSCQPPDVRRSMFVHKTNPPTITQVSPNSGY